MLNDVDLTRYRALIEKHRRKEIDFRLEEGAIEEREEGIFGTVTTTYIPTGKSRLYSTGRDSNWTYFFETDLQRGAFF